MTNTEINKLLENSRQMLRLVCDGNHAHTARAGCLAGHPLDLAVVKLGETLLEERVGVLQLARKIED